MERLIMIRNQMKARKPNFQQQTVNVYPQNEGKWRKPRGIHSKMRRGFRGNPAMPSIGYGSPKAVKGLDRQGDKLVLVENLKQLENLKNEKIILSSTLGLKKKIAILTKAKEKNIKVANVKDIGEFLEDTKKKIESKKSEESKKREKKSKTKEEAEKKAKEKAEEKKNEPEK